MKITPYKLPLYIWFCAIEKVCMVQPITKKSMVTIVAHKCVYNNIV